MPISFVCPECGKKLKAPDDAAGKKSPCRACGRVIVIPESLTLLEQDDHSPSETHQEKALDHQQDNEGIAPAKGKKSTKKEKIITACVLVTIAVVVVLLVYLDRNKKAREAEIAEQDRIVDDYIRQWNFLNEWEGVTKTSPSSKKTLDKVRRELDETNKMIETKWNMKTDELIRHYYERYPWLAKRYP